MSVSRPTRVLLVCAAGFSTVLLKKTILKAAEAAGFRMELYGEIVDGLAYRDFENDPFDIILLAPQVRFLRKVVAKRVAPFGIVVQPLDSMAFGMMDGEKLVQQIQEALAARSSRI